MFWERILIVQGIYLSLLSSAYTEPFSLLTPLHQWAVWVYIRNERGQSQDSSPYLNNGIFHTRSCSAVKWGEGLGMSPLPRDYLDMNPLLRKCSFALLIFLGLYFFHFIFIEILYCCCLGWLLYYIWILKLMTSTVWILFIQYCWDRE